ncbi:MAG: outer membrane lipoprotein LolB [Herminiimonas sp.]|nr:outer membrane lipoprotein LolB [Herminiimonas sp.]
MFSTRSSRLLAGRRIVLIGVIILMSGCTSLAPPVASDTAGPVATPGRPYRDAIDIGGRLSVRYQLNGNDQALDGKFTWTQEPGRTLVTLLSPFGQTLATIDITPTGSTLLQSGKPPRQEADVDALAAAALGWPLPVSGLREWLQGFATDAQGTRRIARADALGDAAYLETADGWLLHYPTWEPAATSESARPKRIDLQRLTNQAGNVTLRIVLDQWQPR